VRASLTASVPSRRGRKRTYCATGNTVKHNFIAGEQVVCDSCLVRIDQDEIMRDVVKAGERIAGGLNMKRSRSYGGPWITPCTEIIDTHRVIHTAPVLA